MNSAIEGDVEEAPDEFAKGPDKSIRGKDYTGRCRKGTYIASTFSTSVIAPVYI